MRGHDPASRRIIEDEAVEEERAGAGDPTDPQPPKVAVPGIEDVIELPVHRFTRFASTFLKNNARAIVACDFFVTVTSTFRLLYVLVVIEHRSRRLIHCNVTAHPTAAWTRQQLRQALVISQ